MTKWAKVVGEHDINVGIVAIQQLKSECRS